MQEWNKPNNETEEADENTKIDRRHEYFVITLRFLAAAYILYMGFLSIKKAIAGEEGIPLSGAVIVALIFLAAAIGILVNAWGAWKKLKQARSAETMEQEEKQRLKEGSLKAADSFPGEEL